MRIAHRTIIRRIETRAVIGSRGRISHPVVVTTRWGRAPRIVAWRVCAYGSEAIMIWIECECRRGKSDI